jgi:PEP-CTERM motif
MSSINRIAGLAALLSGAWAVGAMPAGAVTVDGVTFSPGDVFAVSNFFQNSPTGLGQQLQAIGQVTQIISPISGTPNNTACSSCELNFVVNGYTNTTGPGSTLGFTGGTITLFVDPTGTFNQNAGFAAQAAAIAGGQAWLDLSGHTNQNGLTLTAQLMQNGQVTNAQGSGLLDALVGPGAADSFFTNLNTISDGHGGFADLEFSSTVNNLNPPGGFAFNGGAQIQTVPPTRVPEPATMAILGSSLLAFGAIRRSRKR